MTGAGGRGKLGGVRKLGHNCKGGEKEREREREIKQ